MVDALHKTKNSIKQFVIPGMLFENMGLTYLGPVDGHKHQSDGEGAEEAKRKDGPVLVHVLTEKGRGYAPAVRHPARFHGTAPFEIEDRPSEIQRESHIHGYIFQQSCGSSETGRRMWWPFQLP